MHIGPSVGIKGDESKFAILWSSRSIIPNRGGGLFCPLDREILRRYHILKNVPDTKAQASVTSRFLSRNIILGDRKDISSMFVRDGM